jgi:CO/xanthine dehydrogenase FAD-binding subunit
MLRSVAVSRPKSKAEAVELKARHGERARYWAGGTDLYLLMERRGLDFDHCIDLSTASGLKGITEDKTHLSLGAMTSLAQVERAFVGHRDYSILSRTVKLMCTPQTRTLATIGGNMCHAAPSADLAPALIALDAEAVIAGSEGQRIIPLADFFRHVNKTALAGAELLEAIRLPKPSSRMGADYHRVARTVVDIALVSSGVCLHAGKDGRIHSARIVLGAVAPTPVRASAAESLLMGKHLADLARPELLASVGEAAAAASMPITDIRGSEWYRRRMCDVLTRRALSSSRIQIEEAR